jgi:hypothetical protein
MESMHKPGLRVVQMLGSSHPLPGPSQAHPVGPYGRLTLLSLRLKVEGPLPSR